MSAVWSRRRPEQREASHLAPAPSPMAASSLTTDQTSSSSEKHTSMLDRSNDGRERPTSCRLMRRVLVNSIRSRPEWSCKRRKVHRPYIATSCTTSWPSTRRREKMQTCLMKVKKNLVFASPFRQELSPRALSVRRDRSLQGRQADFQSFS